MSIFKKKRTIVKNANLESFSVKLTSPHNDPRFTDYDKKRLQNHDRKIDNLQAQIRLLADHLGFVIMKHDRFDTIALVSKDALKGKEPKSDVVPQGETTESEE